MKAAPIFWSCLNHFLEAFKRKQIVLRISFSCHECSNDQRCFFCTTQSLLPLVAFTHNGGTSFQLSQAPHSDRTATAGWKPNEHTALFFTSHDICSKRHAKSMKKRNISKHLPCVLNNPPQIPRAGFLTINYQNYIHTSHFGG